jgi:hypothetical protein
MTNANRSDTRDSDPAPTATPALAAYFMQTYQTFQEQNRQGERAEDYNFIQEHVYTFSYERAEDYNFIQGHVYTFSYDRIAVDCYK